MLEFLYAKHGGKREALAEEAASAPVLEAVAGEGDVDKPRAGGPDSEAA